MPAVPFEEAIAAAKAGQIVSFPTDTVPALAVLPERAASLFALKGRSFDKPLILMGAVAADLWQYASGSDTARRTWQAVAERFWPGALTLVLPSSPAVPAAVHPIDLETIGLRVPARTIAQRFLARTGPLATTSANRSGSPPLLDRASIVVAFPEVAVLAEGQGDWETGARSGRPSTVVKWQDDEWQVLRQGEISISDSSYVIGDLK